MLLNLFIDSISATRGNCTSIEENNDNIWLMSMADYVSLAVWYLQWYLDAFQRLLLYDTMIFTLCAQYNGSIHIPLVQNYSFSVFQLFILFQTLTNQPIYLPLSIYHCIFLPNATLEKKWHGQVYLPKLQHLGKFFLFVSFQMLQCSVEEIVCRIHI